MLKNCFENQCSNEVTYSCNCDDPSIYICDKHLPKHTRSPKKHQLNSLLIELVDDEKSEIFPKLKDMIKYLHNLRKDILISAENLVECIEKGTRQALKDVKNLEKIIINLLSNKIISKECYDKIEEFDLKSNKSIMNEANNLKKKIKELFIVDFDELSWRGCDQMILSRIKDVGNMTSININSFKVSILDYTPKIGVFCHACKIDKNNYIFMVGDWTNLIEVKHIW